MKRTLVEYIKDCHRLRGVKELVHPDEAARLVRVGKAKLTGEPKRNKRKTIEAEVAD